MAVESDISPTSAERLIFSLDAPGASAARELIATLGDSVSFVLQTQPWVEP